MQEGSERIGGRESSERIGEDSTGLPAYVDVLCQRQYLLESQVRGWPISEQVRVL